MCFPIIQYSYVLLNMSSIDEATKNAYAQYGITNNRKSIKFNYEVIDNLISQLKDEVIR